MAELGYSIEKNLFGATFRYIPEGSERHLIPSTMPGLRQYGLALYTFEDACWVWNPTVSTVDNDIHWPSGQPLSFDRYPIPTFFSASLQMQDFWDNVVATKGRSALRPPRPFKAPVLEMKELTRVYSVVPNPDNPQTFEAYPDVAAKYQDCVDHLQLRKKAWKHWRGISGQKDHLAEAYAQWQRTPYSLVECRNCVELFTDAAGRLDERTCTHMIVELGDKIETWEQHAGEARPLGFVYTMLLKLMKASMPWRRIVKRIRSEQATPQTQVPNRWHPSVNALVKGTKWRFPDRHVVAEKEGKTWKVLDLYSTKSDYKFITSYDARSDLISSALREGQRCWTILPTPTGLLEAIRTCAHELMDVLDHEADAVDYNTQDWLPFNFSFPEWDISFEQRGPSDEVGNVVAVAERDARKINKDAHRAFLGSPPPSPLGSKGDATSDDDDEDEEDEEEEEKEEEEGTPMRAQMRKKIILVEEVSWRVKFWPWVS